MSPYAYLCSGLFCLILLSPAARAQDTDQDKAKAVKAQAYLNLATSLFKEKDFEGALDSLQRAEPLVKETGVLPLVLFNIARCYQEIGRPIEALAAYRRYLETGEPSERRQKRAHGAIKSLRAKHVGRLVVNCAPKDADIQLVDFDKKHEGCPADFGDVLAQEYTLEVSKPGYITQRRVTVVVAAKATRVQIALTKAPMVQPPATSAKVATEIQLETETRPQYLGWWLWSSAGLSAVTGAVFHGLAVKDSASIESQAPGQARDDALATFESKRAITLGLYGVSLALITAALLSDQEANEEDLTQLWVHPTGFGASLSF